MRDRYAIPLLLLVLLVLGGAGVWYVSGLITDEIPEQKAAIDPDAPGPAGASPIERHLNAEAMRLAGNVANIEQPDARWIAEHLTGDPTANRLQALINQRYHDIHKKQADRIQREIPDLYDRPRALRKLLGSSNGLPRIEAAAAVVEELKKEERFERVISFYTQPEKFPPGLRREFLERTAPVHEAFKSVHEDGLPVYVHTRPSELEVMADTLPKWYDASKIQLGRIRLYMHEYKALKAAAELDVMLGVFSRTHVEASFVDALIFVVFSEQLVDICMELADSVSITTERLESWLALGRGMQLDFMVAFAMEVVDRLRLIGHGKAYADMDVSKWLDDDEAFQTVEEFFSEERRWLEGLYALAEYASNPHPRLDSVQGQKDARRLDTRTVFLMRSNTSDAAKSALRWTALELRILERKIGSLRKNRAAVAQVVGASGLLRAEWNSTKLEVWIDEDVFYDTPDMKPLFTLR